MDDTGLKEILRYIKFADSEDLDILAPAIAKRQAQLKNDRIIQLSRELKRGDRVRLQSIKPRYMNGQQGVVQAILGAKVTVLMDNSTPRFGRTPRVPITCLEKIE